MGSWSCCRAISTACNDQSMQSLFVGILSLTRLNNWSSGQEGLTFELLLQRAQAVCSPALRLALDV